MTTKELSPQLYEVVKSWMTFVSEPWRGLSIPDPDPFINCDVMEGNDASLTLEELPNQDKDKYVYICNHCKERVVVTLYHCTVCDDFDSCIQCYEKEGHPHKMEKLGLDLEDGSSPSDQKQVDPQEARKLSIRKCIHLLTHACHCRDASCCLTSCQKMKRVVTHTRVCKRKTNGGCPVCKQLLALCCYHAKHCQETQCPVPFCLNIRHKLIEQQLQRRLQQAQLLLRRMAMINKIPLC